MTPETNSSLSAQPPAPSGHRPLLGFMAVGLGLALTLFALLWPGRPSEHAVASTSSRDSASAAFPSGCTRNLVSAGSAIPARASGCCPTPSGHAAPDACEMHGGRAKQPDQPEPHVKALNPGAPNE